MLLCIAVMRTTNLYLLRNFLKKQKEITFTEFDRQGKCFTLYLLVEKKFWVDMESFALLDIARQETY